MYYPMAGEGIGLKTAASYRRECQFGKFRNGLRFLVLS
jgi:hypothetical protein